MQMSNAEKAIETGLFHNKTHCNLAKDIGLMISRINPFFFCTFIAVAMASYRLLEIRILETVLIEEFLYIWNWFQRTKATGTYCLTGKLFHCFGCKTHHSNHK